MSRKLRDIPAAWQLYPTWRTMAAQGGGDGARLPMSVAEFREAQDKARHGVCAAPSCGRALVPPAGYLTTASVDVHVPARKRRPEQRYTAAVCNRDCAIGWISHDMARQGFEDAEILG